MEENKKLAPKSFRIDDATAAKFKEIAVELGDGTGSANQQVVFSKLIEAYEFQSGKVMLADKRADIEQFEKYVTALTRKYMDSLEDNQNLSQTIRTEFDAQLKSKDATIQDLQSQLVTAKQLKEDATMKAKSYADENSRLNGVIESLNSEYNAKMDDMQAMLADKDNLNKALTDSCNELKSKVESLEEAAGQASTLQSELEKLQKEHDKTIQKQADLEKQLKQDQADYKKQLQQEQAAHEKAIAELQKHEADALERVQEQSQLAQDKAVLEVERKYQDQLQKLKSDSQAEIDKYQQKYFELLEQIKNQSGAIGPEPEIQG